MGINYLVKLLNMTLVDHIKKCLPELRENLIKLIDSKQNELK